MAAIWNPFLILASHFSSGFFDWKDFGLKHILNRFYAGPGVIVVDVVVGDDDAVKKWSLQPGAKVDKAILQFEWPAVCFCDEKDILTEALLLVGFVLWRIRVDILVYGIALLRHCSLTT